MLYVSHARARGVQTLVCAACLLLWFRATARAEDEGPFFESGALPRTGYEVRISLRYHDATRNDFTVPVFLFAQPARRIHARELRGAFDLRIAITPALAMQMVVPITARWASARLEGLLVSEGQRLPDPSLNLSGVGISDATLGAAYRFVRSETFAAYADAGTRIPFDDNPGALTLPERLPPSTGQNALYLGLGANLQVSALALSLLYRFEYYPGNAASYLLRRVSAQGYTSGSLSSRTGHRVSVQAAYALNPWWSVHVAPEWSVSELPRLATREGDFEWLSGKRLQEFAVGAEVRWRFHRQQTIAVSYRGLLLSSTDEDPFFPIAIPSRGVGLAWHATGF